MRRTVICFMLVCGIFCLSSCQSHSRFEYYDLKSISEIINSNELLRLPPIDDNCIDKYQQSDFLFDNKCFSFCRDMDYFLPFSARFDTLDGTVSEYPPQIVRTIENNGQKSLYLVYETDDNVRIFLFFFESDNYAFSRGYPIVMKKSLQMKDFDEICDGDSIKKVNCVDPIADYYKQGYDRIPDDAIERLYINGKETISTVHLLIDGAIRIDYQRDISGDYIITNVYRSPNFALPMIGGMVRYLIYPDDYVE